jgi:hypothetical protein
MTNKLVKQVLMTSVFLTSALIFAGTARAEAETKKVCETQSDSKGVEKQVCKTIKIHKKLEVAPAAPAPGKAASVAKPAVKPASASPASAPASKK